MKNEIRWVCWPRDEIKNGKIVFDCCPGSWRTFEEMCVDLRKGDYDGEGVVAALVELDEATLKNVSMMEILFASLEGWKQIKKVTCRVLCVIDDIRPLRKEIK